MYTLVRNKTICVVIDFCTVELWAFVSCILLKMLLRFLHIESSCVLLVRRAINSCFASGLMGVPMVSFRAMG